MIVCVKGDLLKSNCSVIAHGCNCQRVMGAGIAKQVRNLYPEAYRVYMNDDRQPHDKMGSFTYTPVKMINDVQDPFKWEQDKYRTGVVFNLYQQLTYGRGGRFIDYDAFKMSLTHMSNILPEIQRVFKLPYMKVGLPYGIGSTMAGGDRSIIHGIIDETFKHTEVYLYEL